MLAECHAGQKPWFVTWTFAPEHYADSEKACKDAIRLLWMRLRKAGHDIRYFTVIERGALRGRLHGHSILWSNSLTLMGQKAGHAELERIWKNGIVDLQPIRRVGALGYVTKYLVKDLSEEGTRNYTWSLKLGDVGFKEWERQVYHEYEQTLMGHYRPFSLENLPSNHLVLPTSFGNIEVWIPKNRYVNFCKALGVDFQDGKDLQFGYGDPLGKDADGSSEPKKWWKQADPQQVLRSLQAARRA